MNRDEKALASAAAATELHRDWLWKRFRATALLLAQWNTPGHLLPELTRDIARLVLALQYTRHVHLCDDTPYQCFTYNFMHQFELFLDEVIARRYGTRVLHGARVMHDVRCVASGQHCHPSKKVLDERHTKRAVVLHHAANLQRILKHTDPRDILWVTCRRDIFYDYVFYDTSSDDDDDM